MSVSNFNIDDMIAYAGEIRLFAGAYTPKGWADCDGTELPIKGNEVLYTLIRTTFGGDGTTTFKLPDLRTRVPVGTGPGPKLTPRKSGDTGGAEAVALTVETMPYHNHVFQVENRDGTAAAPNPGQSGTVVLANMAPVSGVTVAAYTDQAVVPPPSVQAMAGVVIGDAGEALPHSNIMPSIGMRYIIARQGLYPIRP